MMHKLLNLLFELEKRQTDSKGKGKYNNYNYELL